MESGGDENTKSLNVGFAEAKPNKDNGSADTKEGSAAISQPGIVLSTVDRLETENAQLRLMNESARYAALRRDLEECGAGVERLKKEYLDHLQRLESHYGFDLSTTEMEPRTGRIVPRGTLRR